MDETVLNAKRRDWVNYMCNAGCLAGDFIKWKFECFPKIICIKVKLVLKKNIFFFGSHYHWSVEKTSGEEN